jgi:Spy/CpxP family protein refolding chaperone
MKKRGFLIGLILLTVVNLSAFSALAYRRWCRYCEHRECCASEPAQVSLQRKLGLTREQSAAMEALHSQFADAAKGQAGAIEREQMELTRELMKAHPDTAAIRAILHAIADIQLHLQRLSVDHLIAQKAILDSEQQQKLFGMVLHSCAMNPSQCINPNHEP